MDKEPCSWNHENQECRFLEDRVCLLEYMSIGDSPECYRELVDKLIQAPPKLHMFIEALLKDEVKCDTCRYVDTWCDITGRYDPPFCGLWEPSGASEDLTGGLYEYEGEQPRDKCIVHIDEGKAPDGLPWPDGTGLRNV